MECCTSCLQQLVLFLYLRKLVYHLLKAKLHKGVLFWRQIAPYHHHYFM
jgi:hypothetical protein